MWSSRLFWKLFLVYAGLNVTLAVGFLVLVTAWQRTQVNEQVKQRLHDTAVVLRSHTRDQIGALLDAKTSETRKNELRAELQELVKKISDRTQTRLTLVAASGKVLADSERDPLQMNDHSDRPELIDAGRKGLGTSIRPSPTLGVEMSYLALPIRENDRTIALVRTSMELETINRRMAAIRRFLWLFALVVGLIAAALTYAVLGRVIRPLSDLTSSAQAITSGGQQRLVRVEGNDEVAQLAEAFAQMHDKLDRRARQSRENRDQLATVLGSMTEGIIAVDADQKIILANDASQQLVGWADEKVEGRPLIEVVRIHALHQTVEAAMNDGQSSQAEFETSDKRRRLLSIRATPLPGEPCPGTVIVLHDVSELRRLENLRYELFANVSHELKTPLAAIKASAETLRLGAINDAQHNLGFVTCIEEQAERLHQLILDMLHIARIESGKESFDIVDVDVEEVVRDCIAQSSHKASLNEIHVTIEPPDEPVCVRADKEGLQTILENLLDNAIKYTPQGGQVTVSWAQHDSIVALQVNDTGVGIAEEDQSRIFERFFRVDKARSREVGGTGLGLSIVKHLCQAFGGSVELQSTPGRGSTFTVHLPEAGVVHPLS